MKTFPVPLPKISFCGFESYELLQTWSPPPPAAPAPVASGGHPAALDQAYIAGATHMARLHVERAKAAARRLVLERTAWGFGVVVALVLGYALSWMGW